MADLPAIIISGLISGATYALLALGIVVIFRSTDTVNFAIGDIGTVGVFTAASLIGAGLPVPMALIAAIVVAGLVGVVTERLLIRPLGHSRNVLFVALVITIGLGLLIHAGITVLWGTRPRPFPPLVAGSVSILGVVVAWNKIMAAGIAVIAMVGVAWFFKNTPFGVAMRATADDPGAARMIGIRAGRVAAIAWFVGCAMAGIASFFLAADSSLNPNLTLSALFRGFAGVFLGGLTSMSGAVIGGLVIGVLDNLAARYVSASFRDTIVFAVIVLVLFVRPSGVLGAGRKERV
ncbi:MAG: branched-chain amino acid ABC transporter permease [Pseudomonadota bacterium]